MSSVILNRDELNRMRKSVLPPEHDQSKEAAIRARKALSEDKLKHWPKTLEALRKKKESFMKDKEDSLEAAGQKLDLEVCYLYLLYCIV